MLEHISSTRRIKHLLNGRFFYLLVSLFLVFMIYPFLNENDIGGAIILEGLYTIVLLASLRVVIHNRRPFMKYLVLSLMILSIIFRSIDVCMYHTAFYAAGLITDIAFYFMIILAILHYAVKSGKITADKIMGAICVYIFIGVMFTQVFALIELLAPGSFHIAGQFIGSGEGDPMNIRSFVFFYFSFVSLTTVGYGDITPVSQPAAAFAVIEAITGQIYLTVTIARLVGLHIASNNVSYPHGQ